jgi:membrane-associated phospholipid phosphatase
MGQRIHREPIWVTLTAKYGKSFHNLHDPQSIEITRTFIPVDYIVISYILITGLLLFIFNEKLDDKMPHILLRMGVLAFIFIMRFLGEKTPGNLMTLIRYTYPLIFITFFYSETAYFKNIIFNDFDPILVRMEEAIFGFQPSIEFSARFPYKWLNEIMFMGYSFYYFLTFLICFAIFLFRREKFKKVTFVIIFAFFFYYLIFIAFPAVGPQFHFPYPDNYVPVYGFFGKFERLLQSMAERPTAAFPSAHIGIGIIMAYFTLVYLPRLLPAVGIVFIIICFATVYLKAHYLVDVLAGFIAGPIIGFLGSRLYSLISVNTHQSEINKMS